MSATRTFDPDPDADRTRTHERADATAGYPGVPPTPAPVSSPPGYEIVGELGRGGMGVVYDAVQTTINRPCALKMVLGSGHAGSVALVRFLAEAEAVAAIDHPHVVRVFEFGNHGGLPFLAMERLDGGSLADRLKATGPLPVAEAVTLLEKIAAGVQAGHDLGIVHRDLKPANILLSSDGTPKVTDFGLAKRDGGSDLTNTHAEMGTPDYMSPEQAKGQTKFVGPTADVYSLGAMLFATLAGRPPFEGQTLHELRMQVIHTEAPSLSKFVPGLPRDLAVIAAKCLAKAPAERYANAAAFADDLRRWRTGDTIVARAAGSRERAWKAAKRNRGLVTTAGVVALALCVGMAATSVAAVRALAEAERADAATVEAVTAAGRADGEATKAVRAAAEANTEKSKAQAETLRAEKQLDRAERLTYASQVSQADRALGTGSVKSAMTFLDRTRWDLRGWEYGHLTTKFHHGHATLAGHTGGVAGVAFSPDGTRLASAGDDGTVRLWDAAAGRELRTLAGHTGGVWGVAFSPDGTRLASAGDDGTVRLWDAAGGRELRTLAGHTGRVVGVAFSPDGTRLASAGNDKTVRLWDAATDHELCSLEANREMLSDFSFAELGSGLRTITSIARDGSIVKWSATVQQHQDILTAGHSFAETKSRHYLVVKPAAAGPTTVWSLITGRILEDEPTPAGLTFVTLADLPDGKRVVFVEDGKIVVRDKAKYAAFQAEMSRRLAEYAKPKPEWHTRSFDEALAAKDLFAARFHLGYLRKLKGNSDLGVRWREALLPKDALPKPGG